MGLLWPEVDSDPKNEDPDSKSGVVVAVPSSLTIDVKSDEVCAFPEGLQALLETDNKEDIPSGGPMDSVNDEFSQAGEEIRSNEEKDCSGPDQQSVRNSDEMLAAQALIQLSTSIGSNDNAETLGEGDTQKRIVSQDELMFQACHTLFDKEFFLNLIVSKMNDQ